MLGNSIKMGKSYLITIKDFNRFCEIIGQENKSGANETKLYITTHSCIFVNGNITSSVSMMIALKYDGDYDLEEISPESAIVESLIKEYNLPPREE